MTEKKAKKADGLNGIKVDCAFDELLQVERCIPNPKNPYKHSDDQIKLLAKIIKAQDWRYSITISNRSGFIVSGHCRLLAAQLLGMEKVPVDYQDFRDEGHEYSVLLADNKVPEFAELDFSTVADGFVWLDEMNYDIELTGFTLEEVQNYVAPVYSETEQDDALPDEKTIKAICKMGDLWLLGEHRLLCGDLTKESDVGRLMGQEKADMVFTDPPYGVSVNQGSKEDLKARNRRTDGKKVVNDDLVGEKLRDFLLIIFKIYCDNLQAGGAIYVCHAEGLGLDVIFRTAFAESGFKSAEIIIWAKDQFAFGRQDYHWRHEPIIYGWKTGAAHYFINDHTQDTVWEIARPKRSEEHPTMKPIELCAKAINNSSKKNQLVLDLFLGSGSTLIACEKTGRKCYGMEIDEHYCDVIIKRWEDFTGGKAELLK